MKNFFLLLFAIFFTTVLYSKGKSRKGTSLNLTITLSGSYYTRLLDSVSLTKDTANWTKSWKYNGAEPSIGYHFSNLSEGNYTFFAKDLFGLRHTISFALRKDTIIRLDPYMGFHPVPLINSEDMQRNTPVYIVYISKGCFADYRATAVITTERKPGVYRLRLSSNREPQNYFRSGIGAVVFDDLDALQNKCIDIKSKNVYDGVSTSNRHMLILAGDKLFHFSDDQSPFEWTLCPAFLRKYSSEEFTP